MARSYVARYRARHMPAGQLARRLARAAAVGAAAAAVALPLWPGAALGAAGAKDQPPGAPLVLAITSMKPSFAEAGHTLVIIGQVRNVSGSAVSGLAVGLQSSYRGFASRSDLSNYAAGAYVPATFPVASTAPVIRAQLGAGRTWTWVARVPASALPMSCFGVYPLTVQVSDVIAQDVASVPVPLPYWPRAGACAGQPRPAPFPISWIWPLIDSPYQGACPGLLSNGLAGSIRPDGRLGGLLTVGGQFAASARLTWAIDPALLDNVRTLTQPHLVGGAYRADHGYQCTGAAGHPASRYAAGWLSQLARAIAGRSAFLTPYADIDVAALTQYGGNSDLSRAFADGQQVASQALYPGHARGQARNWNPAAVVWPADGSADSAVLLDLAGMNVSTVILAMPSYSPVHYTPGAVTSQLEATGTNLHILLADAGLSSLLAQPATASRKAGPIFAAGQLYLAQTAMIAAEAPGTVRPIVVTPPRHWNPAVPLADALLADTVAAPWLRPSTIGQLTAMRTEHLYPMPQQISPAGLSRHLLGEVSALDSKIKLLQSIMVRPDPKLYRAIFGIESSAWRGAQARHAQVLLSQTQQYVTDQFRGLTISAVSHVTLGGKVSNGVPVSIHNALGYDVQVVLKISSSSRSIIVEQPPGPITVPHGKVAELKLAVRAAETGAAATLRLSLWSTHGVPLQRRTTMRISATDFGTFVLILCAVALAIFVLASAARAIRGGRTEPDAPAGPAEPGQVAHRPSAEPGSRPEQPDNVVRDPSDLTPAGPAMIDPTPASPGQRRTGESR